VSRRISFKLYDKDAAGNPLNELGLSLAFQRHYAVNLGVPDDLNILVKKVWLKFLMDSVDPVASDKANLSKAGVTDAVPQGDTAGHGEPALGEPEGNTGDAVAQPQVVDDQDTTTTG